MVEARHVLLVGLVVAAAACTVAASETMAGLPLKVAVLASLPEELFNGHVDGTIAYLHQNISPAWRMAAAVAVLVVASALLYMMLWSRRVVSLLDLHCFDPPDSFLVKNEDWIGVAAAKGMFSKEQVAFMEKVLQVSGLGPRTALSRGIIKHYEIPDHTKTYADALDESSMIIMDCVDNLLKKTGIPADEVDIVCVSCSCFAPTPSMAAMLVNRIKFREDVLTYNLSGMGCSSSLICVDMVKHLLQALPNKLALVVNHENISNLYYTGTDRSMLLVNCLFRLGGAAAFMTNRPKDAARAKYDLKHTVRVHTGRDDESFGCMGLAEDAEKNLGVFLKRSVIPVAGRAISKNLQAMGRRVLPYSEMARVVTNPKYVPNFTRAFEHFLIHTGGRAVLDELEKTLQLNEKLMEPSRAVLWKFGNTSAASTWYILSHIEHHKGLRKGDRIFQLGFGGGFKANSAAWVARRNIKQSHSCWPDS